MTGCLAMPPGCGWTAEFEVKEKGKTASPNFSKPERAMVKWPATTSEENFSPREELGEQFSEAAAYLGILRVQMPKAVLPRASRSRRLKVGLVVVVGGGTLCKSIGLPRTISMEIVTCTSNNPCCHSDLTTQQILVRAVQNALAFY
jgi:hypothetical protein